MTDRPTLSTFSLTAGTGHKQWFFVFQFCDVAISGDHPYDDLAKFGDEKTLEGKKKFTNLLIFLAKKTIR